jgi:hypothetical protein
VEGGKYYRKLQKSKKGKTMKKSPILAILIFLTTIILASSSIKAAEMPNEGSMVVIEKGTVEARLVCDLSVSVQSVQLFPYAIESDTVKYNFLAELVNNTRTTKIIYLRLTTSSYNQCNWARSIVRLTPARKIKVNTVGITPVAFSVVIPRNAPANFLSFELSGSGDQAGYVPAMHSFAVYAVSDNQEKN